MSLKKVPVEYNPVVINETPIEKVSNYVRLLGLITSEDLNWNARIDMITSKASKRLYLLAIKTSKRAK